MNKTELIAAISEKSGLAKKDAEKVLMAFVSTVEETLAAGERVQIVGFGNFEVRDRAEKTGKNPRTGAEMIIPASKAAVFKAGKALKEAVK